jgi:hypothetical protein
VTLLARWEGEARVGAKRNVVMVKMVRSISSRKWRTKECRGYGPKGGKRSIV